MHRGAILDTARIHRGAILDKARMHRGAILAVQGSLSRGAILDLDNIGWSDVMYNWREKLYFLAFRRNLKFWNLETLTLKLRYPSLTWHLRLQKIGLQEEIIKLRFSNVFPHFVLYSATKTWNWVKIALMKLQGFVVSKCFFEEFFGAQLRSFYIIDGLDWISLYFVGNWSHLHVVLGPQTMKHQCRFLFL